MKIIVNPDKEVVKEVREGLKRTGGYCPCRVVKNEDTKCLCKEFREQTSEGECYCGLYIKVK
jgi:ferredoxin-thioredoxin reductase catalytic subunit